MRLLVFICTLKLLIVIVLVLAEWLVATVYDLNRKSWYLSQYGHDEEVSLDEGNKKAVGVCLGNIDFKALAGEARYF